MYTGIKSVSLKFDNQVVSKYLFDVTLGSISIVLSFFKFVLRNVVLENVLMIYFFKISIICFDILLSNAIRFIYFEWTEYVNIS